MAYLTLSSNVTGPAHAGTGNMTGAPGSSGTCASCHSGASVNTFAFGFDMVDITNPGAPVAVTNGKYQPGHKYKVTLTGQNSALNKFGFQATALDAGGVSMGDLKPGATAPVDDHTVGGTEVIEHTGILTGSGGTVQIEFNWDAPAANEGPVTFYGVVNAVNGDGSISGDKTSSTLQRTYNDQTVSVADLPASTGITIFPNPASGQFTLRFENAVPGTYAVSIFDLNGRKLHADQAAMGQTGTIQVQASGWASGMYFAHIVKDGAQRILPIIIK